MITIDPDKIPVTTDDEALDRMAERVFYKSIDLLGGLRQLIEYRALTWLSSLARASFAIVLKEEYMKSEEEIARFTGLTSAAVKAILRADSEAAIKKIQQIESADENEKKSFRVHTAGGIAKLAYSFVKEGEDAATVTAYGHEMAQQVMLAAGCTQPWPYQVLKHTHGLHYPITSSKDLEKTLAPLRLEEIDGKDIARMLSYPIKSPAQLLHKIKKALSEAK
ncbi:hypothetical protein [Hydrogenimonas sp.]